MSELENNLEPQVSETVEENKIQEAVVEEVEVPKEEVLEPALIANDEPVIPEEKAEEIVQALAPLSTGAIGAVSVPKPKKPKKVETPKKDSVKVALKSTRNVTWPGVGKVLTGINYVTPEQAEQWKTRDHITLLSPEDVAKEYGL